MNAPFDSAAVADAAVEEMKGGHGPLILSASAPFVTARELIRRRYMEPGARTLHHQQGVFYEWRGTHYRETSHEEIRSVIYGFLDSAQRLANNAKLAPFNPTRSKVADVLDGLAASAQLPGTLRAPAWLIDDDDPRPEPLEFMACANGLLHLPTRLLIPHTPTFFNLNAVDYPYEREGKEPAGWLHFLDSIWGNDGEAIDTLQELFGLLLTPDTTHQKIFLIVGPKRSGKGTIARVLTALLGQENVAGPTLNSLTQNFGLAPLIGKPLAIIADARLGGRADSQVVAERLLSITGEDALTIDRKYRSAWTGRLPTRFLILTNELPKLSDASGALPSRFIVLLMSRSFYGREDLALTSKLLAELSAILRWAIVGRDRLVERGRLVQPSSAKQALSELEDLASPVGAFVRDRCSIGVHYSVECDALYDGWVQWCGQQHRDHPGTVQTFGRDLRAAVPGIDVIQPRDQKTGIRLRYYQGIGLLP